MRANILIALGIEGTKEDCHKFMELARADFEFRCKEINHDLMGDRIIILPLPEVESPDEPS
jgi:hypothetical protein